MDRPTAADVRALVPAQFDWAGFGYPVGTPDPLEARARYAAARLHLETGRDLDAISDPDEVAVAEHAIAGLVMQETMGGGAAALAVMEQPWLKSFTAGSYSETRFAPGELATRAADSPQDSILRVVNPWPSIARDLWLLATPEQRDAWKELATGKASPVGGIFEVPVEGCWDDLVWPYGAGRGWAS
jgi:hypothetical protein